MTWSRSILLLCQAIEKPIFLFIFVCLFIFVLFHFGFFSEVTVITCISMEGWILLCGTLKSPAQTEPLWRFSKILTPAQLYTRALSLMKNNFYYWHLYLASRYLKVPTHGSPNTSFSASTWQDALPLHLFRTTRRDWPDLQPLVWPAFDPGHILASGFVRPYNADVILIFLPFGHDSLSVSCSHTRSVAR